LNVEFLIPAEIELAEAVTYYNHESQGLGYEFAVEVKRTIARIVQYPNAWTPLSERTRRCRTNRFPYGLIYQVRHETILVVAVMHLRKDPKSWRTRLGPDSS
jgi:plasmid stabilization system protein ParE